MPLTPWAWTRRTSIYMHLPMQFIHCKLLYFHPDWGNDKHQSRTNEMLKCTIATTQLSTITCEDYFKSHKAWSSDFKIKCVLPVTSILTPGNSLWIQSIMIKTWCCSNENSIGFQLKAVSPLVKWKMPTSYHIGRLSSQDGGYELRQIVT